MARYIGLDAHKASCTPGVVGPNGKRLAHYVVQTNGTALVELVKTVARPRFLILEEGVHSAWLYELLSPHVNDLTVVAVRRTRGNKSDESDAYGLAEKLRINAVESRVYKDPGRYGQLREIVRVHRMLVADSTRAQNRLRAMFRSRGITTNESLYKPSRRDEWLGQLPPRLQTAAGLLFSNYDAVEPVRAEAEKALRAESRRHPVCKLLTRVPGLGPIRVAQLVSIIVSPHRFRTRSQLWKYVGFGVTTRSSSDWTFGKDGVPQRRNTIQTRGLNRNHNPKLKHVFTSLRFVDLPGLLPARAGIRPLRYKGAATTVIGRADEDCPIYQHYVAMLQANINPEMAKLTIARQIAAVTLTVWKKEELYDRAKLNRKS